MERLPTGNSDDLDIAAPTRFADSLSINVDDAGKPDSGRISEILVARTD